MSTQILIKRSTTTGAIPTTGDIAVGELAVNTTDKRIFTNNSGTIVELGTTPTTQAVTGNASVGGTFDVVGAVTVGNFTADGTVDLTAATVTIPAPTADTHPATKKYVDDEVNAILDNAPAALDTLNEIAAAINDDANVFTTLTNSIATKLPLAGGTMTGAIDMGVNGITTSVDPATANTLTRKSYVDGLYQSTVDAEVSAAAALASETAAAGSASSAATSASTATTQASAASTSATNAANSATAAASSATSASNSATAAATSATQAASSATAASDSADEAAVSAAAALVSENNAASTLANVVQKTGDSMTGNLTFGDNDKVIFGAGSDLQIYHDGSNSYISEVGTGELVIQARDAVTIEDGTSGDNYVYMQRGNKVSLFYAGAEKLATTSTGIDVTGTATMDGLTVDGNITVPYPAYIDTAQVLSDTNIILKVDANNDQTNRSLTIKDGADKLLFTAVQGGDISFYEDTGTTASFLWDADTTRVVLTGREVARGGGTYAFEVDNSTQTSNVTAGGAMNVTGYLGRSFTIDGKGDISFYDDADNAKFFWDASAERLGLGTTTPDRGLHVYNASTGSMKIEGGTSGSLLELKASTNSPWYIGHPASIAGGDNTSLSFYNAGERMRIDSSGNLLVGKTSTSNSVAGVELNNTGQLVATFASGTHILGRNTNDGSILQFNKDNSTVGSIGASAGRPYFATDVTGLRVVGGDVRPTNGSGADSDATVDLGDSNVRWKDLYLSGGVYLGGTGAANHLDDYETGTFTPSLSTTYGFTKGTVSGAEGYYTKVGDTVHCRITFDSFGSAEVPAAGDTFVITGLPFTASSLSGSAVDGQCGVVHLYGTMGSQINSSGVCVTSGTGLWTAITATTGSGSYNSPSFFTISYKTSA